MATWIQNKNKPKTNQPTVTLAELYSTQLFSSLGSFPCEETLKYLQSFAFFWFALTQHTGTCSHVLPRSYHGDKK